MGIIIVRKCTLFSINLVTFNHKTYFCLDSCTCAPFQVWLGTDWSLDRNAQEFCCCCCLSFPHAEFTKTSPARGGFGINGLMKQPLSKQDDCWYTQYGSIRSTTIRNAGRRISVFLSFFKNKKQAMGEKC